MQSDNLRQILDEVSCYKAKTIAVTKYFDHNKIEEYFNFGLKDFGENKAKEAACKINLLKKETREHSAFHLIGHLQSNKAKIAVENFDLIHSLDSYKLAEAISEAAAKLGKVQDVLIQLNNAEESQKFGVSSQELEGLFEYTLKLGSLRVVGLMNMAPLNASESELYRLFEDVYKQKTLLEEKFKTKLEELSMGMSNDYKIALKCGATMVRLGRILFN